MILADKIINERKKNGWSQEDLADKLSVSRQSVSKWEGAQSVPDLNRIIQMAELFNVSLDYLLKDDMEPEVPSAQQTPVESGTPARKVSMEDAVKYIKTIKNNNGKAVLGTMAFIVSPVILIMLAGLSDAKKFGISKSSIHKDVSQRLLKINYNLAMEVRKVLDKNKAERHIRGGMATKLKYSEQKKTEKNNNR